MNRRKFILGAIGAAFTLAEKNPTKAQTPQIGQPVSDILDRIIYVPNITPPITSQSPTTLPSATPYPERNEFYPSPKMTPLMETCNDGTPGRKLPDYEARLSPLEDTQFPPPGFTSIAISPSREGLSDNAREYVVFYSDFKRKIKITPQLAGTYIADKPTPPAQQGQRYYVAFGKGPGLPRYDQGEVTEFIWQGCPPKNP